MIEESKEADDGGVPGLKPSFGCRKEQKYLFSMLALERVVVDEIEPFRKVAGIQDGKHLTE